MTATRLLPDADREWAADHGRRLFRVRLAPCAGSLRLALEAPGVIVIEVAGSRPPPRSGRTRRTLRRLLRRSLLMPRRRKRLLPMGRMLCARVADCRCQLLRLPRQVCPRSRAVIYSKYAREGREFETSPGAPLSRTFRHPLEELDRAFGGERCGAAITDGELSRHFLDQEPAPADGRLLQPVALFAGKAAESRPAL